MATLTGLRADLVPHREFAIRKWFYASPLWYYHRPGTTEEIRADRRFYQLVDPDLRELCRILLEAGLQTTPSCQGHFYPRERFERIWDELQREQPLILGEGLEVTDSETNRKYLLRDAAYRLPWEDFRSFYREVAAHQSQGYLGIIVPSDSPVQTRLQDRPYRSLHGRTEYDPNLSAMMGQTLFNVYVDPNSPEERAREWMAVTRHLKAIVAEEACQSVDC